MPIRVLRRAGPYDPWLGGDGLDKRFIRARMPGMSTPCYPPCDPAKSPRFAPAASGWRRRRPAISSRSEHCSTCSSDPSTSDRAGLVRRTRSVDLRPVPNLLRDLIRTEALAGPRPEPGRSRVRSTHRAGPPTSELAGSFCGPRRSPRTKPRASYAHESRSNGSWGVPGFPRSSRGIDAPLRAYHGADVFVAQRYVPASLGESPASGGDAMLIDLDALALSSLGQLPQVDSGQPLRDLGYLL